VGSWLIRLAAQATPERSGTFPLFGRSLFRVAREGFGSTERHMHGLIYLIGLIVVVMAILSFFGLR
jgi:hypothetical protein